MVLWVLLVVTFALLALVIARPGIITRRFAFVVLFVLPLLAAAGGLEAHTERSKTVAFCTSCHVMQQYGRSLHIDDIAHVPAAHFINGRVPKETACYACHTQYTVYGGVASKMRGLRHVYVQYVGKMPDKIELYTPYNNRECLYCHEGSRPFEEATTHHSEEGQLAAIKNNRKSCLSKGCHDVAHDITNVDKLPRWPAAGGKS